MKAKLEQKDHDNTEAIQSLKEELTRIQTSLESEKALHLKLQDSHRATLQKLEEVTADRNDFKSTLEKTEIHLREQTQLAEKYKGKKVNLKEATLG